MCYRHIFEANLTRGKLFQQQVKYFIDLRLGSIYPSYPADGLTFILPLM